jgi:hypothetical protein
MNLGEARGSSTAPSDDCTDRARESCEQRSPDRGDLISHEDAPLAARGAPDKTQRRWKPRCATRTSCMLR